MRLKRVAEHFVVVLSGLALVCLASACADSDETLSSDIIEDAPYAYVPPGKADDYRSTRGNEYALSGEDVVRLNVEDAELEGDERTSRVRELVELRFKALSFFLYSYLAQKSRSDANFDYGNFHTTIRQQTFEELGVAEVADEPGAFAFKFEAECAGPPSLLSTIPLKDDGTFTLVLPKLLNSELSSMSYTKRYKNFDPENFDASTLESLEISIAPKPSEADAYPEYNRLFEDGLLDVAIHIGGDYNEKRYDLLTAEELFADLQSQTGLKAPVETFEALRSDSGPFVGEFDANGQTIRFEVTLIHPDMQKEEGVGFDGLLQLYRDSAATHDIVIYDGHAGYNSSYSGIVVHYNPRHAIPADDFEAMQLPDKYQLFVFNGCKTYTSYPDSLYLNPAKSVMNLDIISTVNFSWLSQMTEITTTFLERVTEQREGTHLPRSYDDILSEMNRGRNFDVIYGVHGLSDNPRISPYADNSSLCEPCNRNSACAGVDNLCISFADGVSGCAAACTDDTGCPEGFSCRSAAPQGSDLISTTQCVPTSGSCQ